MTSSGGPLAPPPPLPLLLLLLLTLAVMEGAEASCSAAGRCCEGKDNGCRGVQVYSNSLRLENLLYGNVSKKSCFCDSACVRLGDCCSDYRDHCPRETCHRHTQCFCITSQPGIGPHRVHCLHRCGSSIVGPIPWGHSGPLCHALSLLSSSSWTSHSA